MKKWIKAGVFIVVLALVVILGAVLQGYVHINLSASMARGFYKTVQEPLQAGDFVELCLPAHLAIIGKERGYIGSGYCADNSEPLLKQIVAIGGDTVVLSHDQVVVNRRALPHSATLTHDEKGLPTHPIARGTYILKPNEIWVMGTQSALSWDSRYYGSLPISSIRYYVKPLVTW